MSSAANRAYDFIKQNILDGSLAPGVQIREEEIAELCKISRTPVRDAIRRLESEMFIYRSDSQRSFVTQWSDEDISELYALRTMLEGQAAERAATLITEEGIEVLRHSCDAMRVAISAKEPDVEGFLEQNHIFHQAVTSAASSRWLATTISRLTLIPVVHSTALSYSREQLGESLSEHSAIVRAIEARDPEWAKAQMVVHIRRSLHAKKADTPE
nr:GntR family transcriptional regulator [Sphingomonas sp. Y57]